MSRNACNGENRQTAGDSNNLDFAISVIFAKQAIRQIFAIFASACIFGHTSIPEFFLEVRERILGTRL